MNLINEIINGKNKFSLAITGGGTRAISYLLENGGASSVFLGALVPYANSMLKTYTYAKYEKAVSIDAARAMLDWSRYGNTENHYSISSTSSLAKNGIEREGRQHSVVLASQYIFYSEQPIIFEAPALEVNLNEKRTRLEEEELVARLIIAYTHFSLGLSVQPPHLNSTIWYEYVGMTEQDEVCAYK